MRPSGSTPCRYALSTSKERQRRPVVTATAHWVLKVVGRQVGEKQSSGTPDDAAAFLHIAHYHYASLILRDTVEVIVSAFQRIHCVNHFGREAANGAPGL